MGMACSTFPVIYPPDLFRYLARVCIWGTRPLRIQLEKGYRDMIAGKVMGICVDFHPPIRIFGMGRISGCRDVLVKTATLVELG